MLTPSIIHNFAPKNIKPKTMDRKTKALTGILYSFQNPIFKQRSTPHREPCVQKFSSKKLYTEEIMSVSALPNKVTRCMDNPKPNL